MTPAGGGGVLWASRWYFPFRLHAWDTCRALVEGDPLGLPCWLILGKWGVGLNGCALAGNMDAKIKKEKKSGRQHYPVVDESEHKKQTATELLIPRLGHRGLYIFSLNPSWHFALPFLPFGFCQPGLTPPFCVCCPGACPALPCLLPGQLQYITSHRKSY